ncbi:MAG: flagellar motor protein MotB [Bdellovibrionales bacterium]|nr:flagellar motor protein MotB [Bdellovibrionales bacterium]
MKRLGLALCVLLLGACVSNSKYQKDLMSKQNEIDSLNRVQTELKASLDDVKKAYNEMLARRAEEQKRLNEFKELTAKFQQLIDSGTLKVKIVDGKMVVSLGSDILFPSGSAQLSEKGIETIKAVATEFASIQGRDFQIEGHTDNIPMKSENYTNWDLATARALSVLKLMIDNGMPKNKISAAGFADTKPIANNATSQGRAQNRRIEIVVVPDLSTLPGYDELKKLSEGKK